MDVEERLTNKGFLKKLKEKNKHYGKGVFKVIGEYAGYKTPILIKSKYGELKVSPASLLRDYKPVIKSAVNKNKYCKNQFKDVHGDTYDYSLINYKKSRDKLKIICKHHGVFKQSHNHHYIRAQGCPKCGKNKAIKTLKKSYKESYIEKASKKHNNYYDYSKIVYKGNKIKIQIGCPSHGYFWQNLSSHLTGVGCPKCADEKRGKHSIKGKDYYIKKFKEKHGDFYDYSLITDDIKSTENIDIICPIHGKFKQKTIIHCNSGCKKCGQESANNAKRKYPKEIVQSVKNIRRRLRKFIVNNNYSKEKRTDEIVGCSWLELRDYLNKNPYGFKMGDNNIDVDHIIPLSAAKSEEDLYKLCHFSNLQLLPSYYNQHIKKEKEWNEDDFKKWYHKKLLKETKNTI